MQCTLTTTVRRLVAWFAHGDYGPRMVTATDTESSSRRRVAQSVGAHLSILRLMLDRMKGERESLPADAIGDRIVLDLRIRNVERDIDVVRRKLL